MSVITVNGIIDANDLGMTLPHEHIFGDLSNQFQEPSEATRRSLSNQKVNMSNLDILRRNPLAVKDNLVFDDIKLAEKEVFEFKKAGGSTIVEVTNVGLGRDPKALRAISNITGINIIAGCGYYCDYSHPKDMDMKTVEQILEEIMTDIEVGIDGTGIRSGVIGEIGVSEKIYPNEKKVLAAAAKASAKTGLGIHVHIIPWGKKGVYPIGIDALNILIDNGANPSKIAINHVDTAIEISIDYCKEICNKGAYAQFDCFGHEFYVDKSERQLLRGPFATDIQRVTAIKELIDMGFLNNIMISTDICHKSLLHSYGGWGYDHILTNIVPMMEEKGLNSQQIDTFIKENPKKFLDTGK